MRIRQATIEDAELLFKWANDPEVRRSSFSSRPIAWDEHMRWLTTALDSPEHVVLIGEEPQPVGVLRIDQGVVGITVAPGSRGRGIGKRLLRKGLERYAGPAEAWVKVENAASLAMFRSLGWVEQPNESDSVRFLRPICGDRG